jgi:hypothetical protein
MLAALAAVGLGVSGCGSSSSPRASSSAVSSQSSTPSSTAVPPLSHSQLVARADAICKRVNKEIEATKSTSATLQEIKRFAPRHETIERSGLAELSRLTPSGADRKAWEHILADRQKLTSELVTLVHDVNGGDTATIKALAASKKRSHAQLLKDAHKAGFKDCSRVG